jgi:hypothetical protein
MAPRRSRRPRRRTSAGCSTTIRGSAVSSTSIPTAGTSYTRGGDDANQTTTTGKNFTNALWNGKRGIDGDPYAEYISANDQLALRTAGNAIWQTNSGTPSPACALVTVLES